MPTLSSAYSLPRFWWWMSSVTPSIDETLFVIEERGRFKSLQEPVRSNERTVRLDFPRPLDALRQSLPRNRAIQRLPAQVLYKHFFLLTNERRPARLPDGSWNGLTFEEEEAGPAVEAFSASDEHHALLYLPVHDACLATLDRYMDVHSSMLESTTLLRALSDVWNALRLHLADHVDYHARRPYGWLDDNSFAGILGKEYKDPLTQWRDIWLDSSREKIELTADPSIVSDYAQLLLSSAPTLLTTDTRANTSQSSERVESLPPDLFHRILDYLYPFSDAPLSCTRLATPWVWKRWLTNPNSFHSSGI